MIRFSNLSRQVQRCFPGPRVFTLLLCSLYKLYYVLYGYKLISYIDSRKFSMGSCKIQIKLVDIFLYEEKTVEIKFHSEMMNAGHFFRYAMSVEFGGIDRDVG